MTKVKDITAFLETLFPLETAESFDNPGLLVGSSDSEVSKVLVCLDATMSAVNKASEIGAQLVFSHHPLIFGGIKSVTDDDTKGHIISTIIRNNMSCYAAHTNLDKNDDYSNKLLALKLGASEESIRHLDNTFCGVYGELNESITVGDFCRDMVASLNSSGFICYAPAERKVGKIFAQGGAFDEDSIRAVADSGADTVIAGEIKHHVMLDLDEMGITAITAGHNATERIFMENLTSVLKEAFGDVDFVYFDGSEKQF